ncbi:hypothetical protein NL676_030945 [Syzygium grande]|nr:hypothetical protein NL676_030945 [Syzygium grande]
MESHICLCTNMATVATAAEVGAVVEEHLEGWERCGWAEVEATYASLPLSYGDIELCPRDTAAEVEGPVLAQAATAAQVGAVAEEHLDGWERCGWAEVEATYASLPLSYGDIELCPRDTAAEVEGPVLAQAVAAAAAAQVGAVAEEHLDGWERCGWAEVEATYASLPLSYGDIELCPRDTAAEVEGPVLAQAATAAAAAQVGAVAEEHLDGWERCGWAEVEATYASLPLSYGDIELCPRDTAAEVPVWA